MTSSAKAKTFKGVPYVPWWWIQRTLADQLAAIWQDHPEDIPDDLVGQQLDPDTINDWTDAAVLAAWVRVRRRHEDAMPLDWLEIHQHYAEATEDADRATCAPAQPASWAD